MRQVQIRGRLGADAELRATPSGTSVCNFSVAVNEKRADATETHWFRCLCWAKLAERVHPMLKRGSFVSIHGKLESRSWKDKDGRQHNSVEINAYIVDVLPPREVEQDSDEGGKVPF